MDTREKIFKTASELFAQKGFEMVSTRDITSKAGVNLALINYHFGSKKNLQDEVLRHCLLKVVDEQAERLEAAHGIDAALRAYLEPMLTPSTEEVKGYVANILLARAMMLPFADLPEEVSVRQQLVAELLVKQLDGSLSQVEIESLALRLHFLRGSLSYVMLHESELRAMYGEQASQRGLLEQLIEVSKAAFGAACALYKQRCNDRGEFAF